MWPKRRVKTRTSATSPQIGTYKEGGCKKNGDQKRCERGQSERHGAYKNLFEGWDYFGDSLKLPRRVKTVAWLLLFPRGKHGHQKKVKHGRWDFDILGYLFLLEMERALKCSGNCTEFGWIALPAGDVPQVRCSYFLSHGGTPKSSIFMEFSIISHLFSYIAIYGTPHVHMGVSENSVPLNPMVNDHYPY